MKQTVRFTGRRSIDSPTQSLLCSLVAEFLCLIRDMACALRDLVRGPAIGHSLCWFRPASTRPSRFVVPSWQVERFEDFEESSAFNVRLIYRTLHERIRPTPVAESANISSFAVSCPPGRLIWLWPWPKTQA